MNRDAMFSSKTDLWETPQELFDRLDARFHFEVDVCATAENAKCKRYYTREVDGLAQKWEGVCWCDEYGGAITPEDYCSRAVTDKPSRVKIPWEAD